MIRCRVRRTYANGVLTTKTQVDLGGVPHENNNKNKKKKKRKCKHKRKQLLRSCHQPYVGDMALRREMSCYW